MRTVAMRTTGATVVAVNQAVIANATIAREVQNHADGTPRAAWQEATRALIVRELLLQRAHSLGIVAAPHSADGLRETDDEALIRAVLGREVTTPTADEATCHRYYDANRAKFRSPDLFEPLHILFKASHDDAPAYVRAVERASDVLAQVMLSPDRFESLASALSECPSASNGGRLGQVARGDTTPEFEAALQSLEPGHICPEVVHTSYGVLVLRLDRKIAGKTLPFDQVRERIAAYLEERSWRRGVAQYVALLAGRAQITGYDMPGATSPLVQ